MQKLCQAVQSINFNDIQARTDIACDSDATVRCCNRNTLSATKTGLLATCCIRSGSRCHGITQIAGSARRFSLTRGAAIALGGRSGKRIVVEDLDFAGKRDGDRKSGSKDPHVFGTALPIILGTASRQGFRASLEPFWIGSAYASTIGAVKDLSCRGSSMNPAAPANGHCSSWTRVQ